MSSIDPEHKICRHFDEGVCCMDDDKCHIPGSNGINCHKAESELWVTSNPRGYGTWIHTMLEQYHERHLDVSEAWKSTLRSKPCKEQSMEKITECGEYRTRSGETAVVNTICSLGSHPVHGHITRGIANHHKTWQEGGWLRNPGYGESQDDIVAKAFEITEPGRYRTRDGRLTNVTRIYTSNYHFPVEGLLDVLELRWRKDGRSSDVRPYASDIVVKVEEPKIDVTVHGGDVHIGKVAINDAFRNEKYVGCNICIEEQDHSEPIFEHCIFEMCIIDIQDGRSTTAQIFRDCCTFR